MGAKVSIQFKNGDDKSVVLFSHRGGTQFLKMAETYVETLRQVAAVKGGMLPLYRLEPGTVMVDFIATLASFEAGCKNTPVESNYYLGATEEDGDNSDLGHYVIDLNNPANTLHYEG